MRHGSKGAASRTSRRTSSWALRPYVLLYPYGKTGLCMRRGHLGIACWNNQQSLDCDAVLFNARSKWLLLSSKSSFPATSVLLSKPTSRMNRTETQASLQCSGGANAAWWSRAGLCVLPRERRPSPQGRGSYSRQMQGDTQQQRNAFRFSELRQAYFDTPWAYPEGRTIGGLDPTHQSDLPSASARHLGTLSRRFQGSEDALHHSNFTASTKGQASDRYTHHMFTLSPALAPARSPTTSNCSPQAVREGGQQIRK